MPLKCFQKPNRKEPRTWKAKNVGQVYCLALRGGVTRAELEAEIRKCVEPHRDPRSSEALEALLAAARALEENNVMLDADAAFLERFQALSLSMAVALRLIARFFRPAAVLTVGLPALQKLATERIQQIVVRRAANDEAVRIARRAAANEANFLRTGTR